MKKAGHWPAFLGIGQNCNSIESRRRRVYHQCAALYIIRSKARTNLAFGEYTIIAKAKCSQQLMIYTFGDEMHANA